jgi:signal recognition particle subunit SRP54
MGGGRKAVKGQQRKKGKSGNPAKRAQEERAAADKKAGARLAATSSAFGMPGAPVAGEDSGEGDSPPNLDLPKGFEKYLGK